MLGPFDATPVVERLRTVAALNFAGGAAEQGQVDAQRLPPFPCAFAVLVREDIKSTPCSGGVVLTTTDAHIQIVTGVKNQRVADRGEKHSEEGTLLVGQIRIALQNWKPPGADIEPMRLAGTGKLVKLDGPLWWWADPFVLTYRHRS